MVFCSRWYSRWEEREREVTLYLQARAHCCLKDKGREPLGINSLDWGD